MAESSEEYGRPSDERPSFKELLIAAPDLDSLKIGGAAVTRLRRSRMRPGCRRWSTGSRTGSCR